MLRILCLFQYLYFSMAYLKACIFLHGWLIGNKVLVFWNFALTPETRFLTLFQTTSKSSYMRRRHSQNKCQNLIAQYGLMYAFFVCLFFNQKISWMKCRCEDLWPALDSSWNYYSRKHTNLWFSILWCVEKKKFIKMQSFQNALYFCFIKSSRAGTRNRVPWQIGDTFVLDKNFFVFKKICEIKNKFVLRFLLLNNLRFLLLNNLSENSSLLVIIP